MNAIGDGRNELARLGLQPGARHPNVADSTPVQNEDSTIFYNYWTFNNPTVIRTSKTGHPVEVTVCTSATNGDEQTTSIMGETACREYLRYAVAWKSESADLIRQNTAHEQIMMHIAELAEDNSPLAAWVLEHTPSVDVDTENLTLTLFDLYDDPMINLHTSTITGGGWAILPEQTIDNLDNIIASLEFSRLPYMVGMQRESLAEFLTTLSDDLDKAHYDALHAPGVPTLAEAIEAANYAHSVVEAGRQQLARLGFAASKPEDVRYPPELLDNGNVMFYGYKCFDSFAHIVTDVRGRVVEVYAGEPPMVIDDNWEAELTGEIACQEFLRYAAEWDSDASRNERHHAIHQGISEFIREQVKRDSSLEAWARSTDPHLNECTVNDISITFHDKEGQNLLAVTQTLYGNYFMYQEAGAYDTYHSDREFISSPSLEDACDRIRVEPENFATFITNFSKQITKIHSRAIRGDKWETSSIVYEAARAAQDTAAHVAQRSSIPPEMLGRSTPHIGKQAVPTTPMRWVPSPTIHQAEGRSL